MSRRETPLLLGRVCSLWPPAEGSVGYTCSMNHSRDSDSQAGYGSISRRSSYQHLAGAVGNSPFGVVFDVSAILAPEHHTSPPRNDFNRFLLSFAQVAGRNSLSGV
ncbi:hypothetical protein F5887DRAFT_963287 [Amanita rubescens]|nr:hypothetical protein F5887DRAFT_963287 [Amanita rubescens]